MGVQEVQDGEMKTIYFHVVFEVPWTSGGRCAEGTAVCVTQERGQ